MNRLLLMLTSSKFSIAAPQEESVLTWMNSGSVEPSTVICSSIQEVKIADAKLAADIYVEEAVLFGSAYPIAFALDDEVRCDIRQFCT